MKLTKKLEAEILKVYNTVWDAYLRGDMRTFASTLDENCYIIGSAAGEVFKNKKAAVKYYKSTAEQITGKAEFRNRKIKVMPVEKGVMVNEQSDFYLLIDDQWTFYGPARISSLFHKKNNKWKVIHQHGSFPDSKTEEGEQVNTDKIKAENIQLRDAVKRRTEELENKNRELEIETSLEKVRTIAMGMRKPEDFPDVCEVLFNELQLLGFNEIRNAMVNIHNDENKSFVNYDYSDEIGKSITPLVYNEHPVIKKQVKQIRKADDAFSESVFKGKDLEDWKTFRKSRGEKNDKRIRNIKALYYYFYSIGTGSIGISTFDKINEEKKDVLKRFRNVFAFAYRRYMDVAQAEAQAKEARVELALERVRARAMAMHNSDELAELVATVFNELTYLDFKLTSCIIWIHDHEKAMDILWIASAEINKPAKPFRVTPFHKGFFGSIVHAWKAKDPKWVYAFTGVEKKKFEKAFFRELPNLPDALKKALNVPRHVVFSASFNNFGGLEIVETEALTDEKFEILHRFGKVFDLSYTRFNDLQKAEAQTREAQIEAALEKVRGRAMAMHKSEELLEAGALLYSELSKLGIEKLTSGYMLIDEDEKMGWNYGVNPSNGQIIPKPVGVPLTETKEIRTILESWKKQEPIHVKHLDPKETIVHQSYMAEHAINFPITKEKLLSITPERLVIHTFNFKQGYLIIVRGEELAAEQQEMVVRFAKVFEMTYRRFLDLQKAEAQVREAQIETALERVRSKTMAMHKSEEVTGIAVSLNEELLKLGFDGGSTIMIIDKETGDTEQWTGFSEDKNLKSCYVPYFKHPYHDSLLDDWKREEKFLVYTLTGEEKKTIDEHYFATGYKDFPESDKKWMREMGSVTFSHAFMKYGAIHWGPDHLTEEQLKILQRFSKVFEQSYTRFLDLQKAEAQARESQIQLALERLRARTMAMHQSSELAEAASIMFEQLSQLGASLWICGFNICKKDSEITEGWICPPDGKMMDPMYIPYTIDKFSTCAYETWRNQGGIYTDILEGIELQKSHEELLRQPSMEIARNHLIENAIAIPTWVQRFAVPYTFGYVIIVTTKLFEETDIFLRFAKVFDQTYTRFLDLQKAEEQAREAKIEAALERVRSRSMAMHKSDDLHEVIKVVTEQLYVLGLKFNVANFAKIDPDGSWDLWLSTPDQTYPALIHVPYIDHPIFSRITEEGTKRNDFFTDVYSREEANIFFHHFFENTIAKNTPEERKQFVYNSKGFARSIFLTKNIWFSVSRYDTTPFTDEENAIFKRFANVFEQAYTRFLDLQKAEAQARETEIELSLERVRAKTMAMQKPSEFVDIINIIGEQFVHLGFDIDWANFGANGFAISEGIDIWNFAVIPGGSPISARVFIPYFDHPVFTTSAENINEFLNGGRDLITVTFDKQTKDTWLDQLFTKTIFKDVPEEYRVIQYAKPGYTTSNISIKDTWLSIGKFDSRPFTDEQHLILRRFAKAFGQANTRFLDLQKAEAQAREAQIEASLERVRSRAMAMQNSDELRELIGTVFTELTKLDITLTRCLIMIYDPRSNDSVWWMANSEAPTEPIGLRIQNHEHPPYAAYLKAWQEKKLNWVYVLEGAVKKDWDNFLFVETELSHLPDFVIAGMKAPERVYLNSSFNSFGNLTLASLEPLSNEHFDILLRFAKVFDLTYTRFNDLKQAEAQAKESRIQLALERVRARTMAMQKSNELTETSFLLFQQFKELGSVANQMSIGIINEQEDVMEMFATIDGSKLDYEVSVSLYEPIVMKKLVVAWKEQKGSLVIDLSEDELKLYNEYRNSTGTLKFESREGEHWVIHIAFFSKGIFSFSSHERHSDEIVQLLERFAGVFDLTYTRFLDLQQAEAQAREARIEVALERVRARTMAMQKPDELADAAQMLYREFATLNIKTFSCGYMFIDEEKHTQTAWVVLPDGTLLPNFIVFPLTGDHVLDNRYKDWKEKKPLHLYEIQGEVNKEHHKFLSNHVPPFVVKDIFSQVPDRIVFHCANFSNGYLLILATDYFSQEEQQTIIRFAKVFEMTYTRFLDLKQAEAQTREAQIELALERVRARTMAMHKSEELAETSQVLFHQLSELGGIPDRISIGIADEINGMVNFWSTDQQGSHLEHSFSARLNERTTITKTYQAWKEQKRSLVIDLHGEELKEWIQFAREEMGIAVKDDQIKDRRVHSLAFFSHGWILVTSHEPQSTETIQILERFASVFNLTYRRFLDLQKAEAQAREALIEMALEKVRSRSLAMHKSDELQEVVDTVFERLQDLNIEMASANIAIFKEGTRNYDYWIASPAQKRSAVFHLPYTDLSLTKDLIAARESGKEFSTTAYSFEEKNEWFGYAFKNTDFKFLSEERKQFILNAPAITVAIAFSKNTGVQVNRYNNILYTEGEGEILKRFSKVFEQAYIRFLDLQKAEANAREAQIEAGLERVRAKAMAMHSSKDLAETLSVFYRELKSLSVVPIRCGVALMDKESRMAELTTMNTTGEGDSIEIIGKIKMAGHPVLDGVFESWLIQKEYHAVLRGNQIKEYYQVLKPQIDYLDYSNDEAQFGYYFMFNEGDVYAWTEKELTEDELTIYRRFTTVISLTYKRYKDLQQAEAQAKEAKIEAGLERVRARTMAMHSSEDVGAATATMFTELEKLGIQNLRGGITIIKAGDKQEVWGVTNLPDGKTIRSIGEFDMHLHALWRELLKAKLNKGDYNYYRLAGKDKEDYINILNATPNYLSQPIKDFPDVHVQSYFFGEGAIWTNSLQPHSEEDKQVMKRFASVFSLTFRRYQDLQKAEAQAREATIEAALERVRGKAMAMHSSKDLASTIGVFYHELEGLDLTPRRCGIGLINKETKRAEISTMNASADGEGIEMVGNLDLGSHPVLRGVYDNWLSKTDYHPVLRGNEIKEYYQVVRPQIDFPDYPNDIVQFGYFFFFDEGGVYAWTEKELSEEELKIYRRFTSVLSLTYKRYKDLKDAEASAQAAIKDAALDRIRADIASMRTIADLDRITPLIWNELTILGIPFIRCGVFIMDDEQQLIHTFLSTPDGKAIAAFHLPYDTPGNLNHVVTNWKKNKKYIDHWGESEFKQFAEILMKQGALVSAEQYLKTIPKGGFYLHFLPFLQGMLYVGNTTQLQKEDIELIQHIADAFSTAYARYEDFNKLEAAKQQVEKTLSDLKQAQTQLVQSEKMASLGEMTAGIAHEIQNPLNFVNNFSEVSKELLDEMKTELETGNTEEAKGIADDVIQNLEKINHHGKRADAIVKSMLQHSRSSSGKKEPADINGLADEYLRLAYHGLRAKDKSFNAKFETEFDSSIGKINIISQDIGRVLVNLINNAFYAVSERKKQETNGYEPTVTVHTKKTDDKIEIMVKDNGNGIPQKVLDKIFQPFFTTKPTGQGTGLGLSLAYDIVTKGHGGELKVETKEGEGSEFIIQLPG